MIERHLKQTAVDEGFDYRWLRHPKPQRTTGGNLDTVTLGGNFEQKTGWTLESLRGKRVLDVGCGCGRFLGLLEKAGVTDLTGIDGSFHALKAAELNAPSAKLHHANIFEMPFEPESFDAVFSIGVLHHTGDTERALQAAGKLVKQGGELAIWVYTPPELDTNLLLARKMFHEITRAVPPETLYDICTRYAPTLRDAFKTGIYGSLPNVLAISWSTDDEECISDTFDWHTPQFRDEYSIPTVATWFQTAGFAVVWTGDFPVSMRGKKL